MNANPCPVRCLAAAFALLVTSASAQTAIWIAPGSIGLPGSVGDWSDPANWDTGVVPNGSTAVAVINQSTNASFTSAIPGGAQPVLTGNITLGELRFDLPAAGDTQFAGLYLSSFFGSPPPAPGCELLLFIGS